MVHLVFIDKVNMLLILNKHHCNTGYTSYETICLVYILIYLCQFLASFYIGRNSEHKIPINTNQIL